MNLVPDDDVPRNLIQPLDPPHRLVVGHDNDRRRVGQSGNQFFFLGLAGAAVERDDAEVWRPEADLFHPRGDDRFGAGDKDSGRPSGQLLKDDGKRGEGLP